MYHKIRNFSLRCVLFFSAFGFFITVRHMSSRTKIYSTSGRPWSFTHIFGGRSPDILRVLMWTEESMDRWTVRRPILGGQCEFIDNRIEEYNTSDVVVFRSKMFYKPLPTYRPPGQRWVFYDWESPLHSQERRHPENMLQVALNHFNYSMTYSRSADIFYPYGECQQLTEKPAGNVMTERIDEIIRNKTKLAAWVVSNCDAGSFRDAYIKALQQHIPIDVFGKCGTHQCSDEKNCSESINVYKFYLAFENSLCGEYMTEKLWRSFQWGLVPIVYGALEAYKINLPANSYIDVSNFTSPMHLADYLLTLNEDDTLYRRYFEWKHTFHCGLIPREVKIDRLCMFLKKNIPRTIDLRDIWKPESVQCGNPRTYLKLLGLPGSNKRRET